MIEQGDVEVINYLTKEMWYDVLTKPKQGKAFRGDRSVLMNYLVKYEDSKDW